MDTEQMVERAREMLSPGNVVYPIRPWAEALLAEHDARVEAIRQAERAEAMHAEAFRIGVGWQERAEQAERERDALRRELEFVKTGGVAWCERAATAEARVAALEAALRSLFAAIDRQPYDVGVYLAAVKAARAALGDQEQTDES